MKVIEYIKSLIKANTMDSSKSFSMLLSAIVGALIGLCSCFCMIWDVCSNGYLKTDLDSLGIFLLCAGGFMIGGGFPKAVSEKIKRNNQNTIKNESNKTN